MAKRGFNYSFRMYLEGVLVPFKSATIVCTPNGVEANIAVFSNKAILDIHPKTAVQIFYRDFVSQGKPGWRLMFDGFFSSYYKTDNTQEGRHIGITCRDFRMDIRRSPAAMAYQDKGPSDLGIQVHYNTSGLFHNFVVKGVTPKGKAGSEIRTYGNSGIDDVGEMLRYIAGTAYGKGLKYNPRNGEYYYSDKFGKAMKPTGKEERADGRLFLDSFIRGIWLEATGGTSVNAFLNRRIRVDKRFLVPSNQAGYNFWRRMNAGIQGGGYMLGNARFTSVEAAIMRLAGLFTSRVYSCSTPSLISISQDAPGVDNIIADGVRKFLVDRASAEFGAKYILNETMLLPPLEFTAPPNCNLIFPPMCHRITWQYDTDVDVTRGYFKQVDVLATPGSKASLSSQSYQVPNALFSILKEEGDKKDRYGRKKPPLTLEERYKGVNVHYGSVEYALAADDATAQYVENNLKPAAAAKVREEIARLARVFQQLSGGASIDQSLATTLAGDIKTDKTTLARIKQRWTNKMKTRANAKVAKQNKVKASTTAALKRHALLKFLNLKYAGRVVVVDGVFNPYIMCGFPGAVIADELGYGGESLKTVVGMVQQVKHQIVINVNGTDASTSVVLNNARFEDEPTDMDKWGYPLYMKATDPYGGAEIDINDLEYKEPSYSIPEAQAPVKRNLTSDAYDLDANADEATEYVYAKDLLTLTARDKARAEKNTVYIDEMYEPNRIAKFYSETFPHFSDHFMIGTAPSKLNPKERIFYMYDTIHEGLHALRSRDPKLMTDYQRAIQMVMRDVCSADAFFQGVLGLSVRVTVDGEVEYRKSDSEFDPSRIHDEYFGVTSDAWEDNDDVAKLKDSAGGLMTGPGQMSSIRETMPVTAFIKERKDAVKKYLVDVLKYSQGAQFGNAVR